MWKKIRNLFVSFKVNSKKVDKNLAVNAAFKCRHPVGFKLTWLNPTDATEFGLFSCHFNT